MPYILRTNCFDNGCKSKASVIVEGKKLAFATKKEAAGFIEARFQDDDLDITIQWAKLNNDLKIMAFDIDKYY